MRAHAAVEAVPAGPAGGGCAYATLRSDPPLLLRPTPGGLYLQGGAAGPLGGDRLQFDVHVAAGARLTVRSVAATIVLPGQDPSCLYVSVRVDEGGNLDWQPEPLVSVTGSRHRQLVDIELAPNATLRWHDRLVLGRSGEPPGEVESGLRVERAGVVLFHQDLRVGDAVEPAAWRNSAVVGDGRVTMTELLVGGDAPSTGVRHDAASGARAATVALAPDAWLTQAVGADVGSVDAVV